MESTAPDWLAMSEEEFQEAFRPKGNPTAAYLHRVLIRALGRAVVVPPEPALKSKPLLLELRSPLPPYLRFYVHGATQHSSERQTGTYKVQLTNGVTRDGRRATKNDDRAFFDRSDGFLPVLIGYNSDWNLFILWDADLHDAGRGFSYSKSAQAPQDVVLDALVHGIGRATRRLRSRVDESIVAARPEYLAEALSLRIDLSNRAMCEGLF
ncbi:hypothetical protein [Streptomyces sp. NPDC048224]|uniref:hypothetical protein n=1 Tax=Streptomyces sp. NPDC048224 TaxID=3154500 RepID=UPI0033CB254E